MSEKWWAQPTLQKQRKDKQAYLGEKRMRHDAPYKKMVCYIAQKK
jgi:hypothetical protein